MRYTVGEIKQYSQKTAVGNLGIIYLRPADTSSLWQKIKYAAGVLVGRYDILDWQEEIIETARREVSS